MHNIGKPSAIAYDSPRRKVRLHTRDCAGEASYSRARSILWKAQERCAISDSALSYSPFHEVTFWRLHIVHIVIARLHVSSRRTSCFVPVHTPTASPWGERPIVHSQAMPEELLARGVRPSPGHWCCQCVAAFGSSRRTSGRWWGCSPRSVIIASLHALLLGVSPWQCRIRQARGLRGFVSVWRARCQV